MRKIVLTGCTRGCGRALTDFFVSQGCQVIGCGTNDSALQQLRRKYPAPHSFSKVNVADESQVASWAQALESQPPDFVINNAAIINPTAPLWQQTPATIDDILNINIKGVINVIRHFLPSMLARGSGVVVNFSSGWGRSTSPGVALYCATKYAIEGLTAALAQELPKGLAAVALNPGIIHTDMLEACLGNAASSYPSPQVWVHSAGPFILKLGPTHNGKSLDVP